MTIPPKRVNVVYRGIQASVSYNPENKKWQWQFVVTHRTVFTDYEDSEVAATLTVKKEIDRYTRSQEKAVRRK